LKEIVLAKFLFLKTKFRNVEIVSSYREQYLLFLHIIEISEIIMKKPKRKDLWLVWIWIFHKDRTNYIVYESNEGHTFSWHRNNVSKRLMNRDETTIVITTFEYKHSRSMHKQINRASNILNRTLHFTNLYHKYFSLLVGYAYFKTLNSTSHQEVSVEI
jgi:hypothetical protein